MKTLAKSLRNIAAGALVTFGALAASTAHAGLVFTINPGSNGLVTSPGTVSPFQGDKLVGGSTVRLTSTTGSGAFNYKGVGYIQYSSIDLNSSSVGGLSYLGTDYTSIGIPLTGYNLYAVFTQTFACPAMLAVGVECTVTSIDLALKADAIGGVGGAASFNEATFATDGTVTGGGNQILLATGNTAYGVAGVNALKGAYQNVNTNLILTAEGKQFFTAPDPFYSLTFNSFNNTTTGLQFDGFAYVVTDESGATTFGVVPEPGVPSLIGIGLLGMLMYRRKRSV